MSKFILLFAVGNSLIWYGGKDLFSRSPENAVLVSGLLFLSIMVAVVWDANDR